jgi:integrase
VAVTPLPTLVPKRPPAFVPYIYSQEELRRLLQQTAVSQCRRHQIEPETLHAILLLLYGAGLRVGEAVAMKCIDVDLGHALVTIRRTKFDKSRLVPVGPKLCQALAAHARRRGKGAGRTEDDLPFFVGRRGRQIDLCTLASSFRRLRAAANVCRSDGAYFQPRLHDLRHTFAVHRLLTWYREGADVQKLLPQLSVYLGHKSLASTQVYLSMTPALLQEAGVRFERYVWKENQHV